jgi:hypothetical protein
MSNSYSDHIPTPEALLERLDRFETRLSAVELSGPGQVVDSVIGSKVSLRISTLEKALTDQSAVVTALSRRAVEAEENFQRLISAVERLCERTEPAAGSQSTPFETQLTEAFQRQPATSPLPDDSGFRPRIVRDENAKPRHRKPLAHL